MFKEIKKWLEERAVSKALEVIATAPEAVAIMATNQAHTSGSDLINVVIRGSLKILVHRGDLELHSRKNVLSFFGQTHRPYLRTNGQEASAPLFAADDIVRNICAKIGIQATDPGGEVFCITMYDHVFHDNLSWDHAKKAAESMESVIRDAATVVSCSLRK